MIILHLTYLLTFAMTESQEIDIFYAKFQAYINTLDEKKNLLLTIQGTHRYLKCS